MTPLINPVVIYPRICEFAQRKWPLRRGKRVKRHPHTAKNASNGVLHDKKMPKAALMPQEKRQRRLANMRKALRSVLRNACYLRSVRHMCGSYYLCSAARTICAAHVICAVRATETIVPAAALGRAACATCTARVTP